jgi:hypothetical protein
MPVTSGEIPAAKVQLDFAPMPTIQSPESCSRCVAPKMPPVGSRSLSLAGGTSDFDGEHRTVDGKELRGVTGARSYRKGIKVSKAQMKCLDIVGDQFHPEWNYTISPRRP